jgi:hypothetical protein
MVKVFLFLKVLCYETALLYSLTTALLYASVCFTIQCASMTRTITILSKGQCQVRLQPTLLRSSFGYCTFRITLSLPIVGNLSPKAHMCP